MEGVGPLMNTHLPTNNISSYSVSLVRWTSFQKEIKKLSRCWDFMTFFVSSCMPEAWPSLQEGMTDDILTDSSWSYMHTYIICRHCISYANVNNMTIAYHMPLHNICHSIAYTYMSLKFFSIAAKLQLHIICHCYFDMAIVYHMPLHCIYL